MEVYIVKCEPVKTITPHGYYRKLYYGYVSQLEKQYKHNFWGMARQCDAMAREMYAHIVGRRVNVTDLILTATDAEQVFKYFKICANVWAYQTYHALLAYQ